MGLLINIVILLEPLWAGSEICVLTGLRFGGGEWRKAYPCFGLTYSPMGLCLLWAAAPLPAVRAMDYENQQKL